MSELDSRQGQTVLLPTESHDFDNNADSDSSDSSCISEASEIACEYTLKRRVFLHSIPARMFNVVKEIGLLFLAIFFTYAALTNEPPKVTKSPNAHPFFPKGSMVVDWYSGDITRAYEYAKESDVSFILFYAPWDRKSQDIRIEFEVAARYMSNLVRFTAVNCWHPGSECRNLYSKFYSWPVLIAKITHGQSIVYNGPPMAHFMIRFLTSIMNPLSRIETGKEELLAKYDAVIATGVNAAPGSFHYNVIYNTALLFIEKDPFQEVGFFVHPEPDDDDTGLYPFLGIYTWNNTYLYPNDGEWKPTAMLTWILKTLKDAYQPASWLYPPGVKSQHLSAYVQPGPSLILFTPKSPLAQFNDYYQLLRECSVQYFHDLSDEMSPKSILYNRLVNYASYTEHKLCVIQKNVNAKVSTVVAYPTSSCWKNNSCFSGLNSKELPSTCSIPGTNQEGQCAKTSFEEIDITEEVEKPKKLTKRLKDSQYKTSMLDYENDSHSPKNLKRVLEENSCRLFQMSEYYQPAIFSETILKHDGLSVDIVGLASHQNTTLSFVALDSLKYHQFAEVLGIDVLNRVDKTAAVIIDEKMESHYVLEERLNDISLRQFIYNFTHKLLPRAVQSSALKLENTHVYKVTERPTDFYVKELNSLNFLETVMEPDKAVLVFYYSKQCAFCSGLSYVFLSVARTLSDINSIKFVRIDGELNSLPWEYTMEKFPTILFFPAKSKSESRSYPRNIPFTVPNLLSFVITNLEPSQKLHAMWTLCDSTKFVEDRDSCIVSLRTEILSMTDLMLREWRMSIDSRRKALVLYKLQQLRNLHLLLAHSSGNRTEITKFMKKLYLSPSHRPANKKITKDEL